MSIEFVLLRNSITLRSRTLQSSGVGAGAVDEQYPAIPDSTGQVAKQADARDLKSRAPNGAYGFDSRPG